MNHLFISFESNLLIISSSAGESGIGMRFSADAFADAFADERRR